MQRPRISLKLATSLDGRIATQTGHSKWITGEEARLCVHELRSRHDGVLVGIETALADDPELTVRLADYEGDQPARIILDSRGRLPLNSKLVQTARIIPTYQISLVDIDPEIHSMGVKPLRVKGLDGRIDLTAALELLDSVGIKSLFVEGGAIVATAFLKAGFIDRLEWFRSAIVLGGEGREAFGPLGITQLDQAIRFERLAVQALGSDLWESYELS